MGAFKCDTDALSGRVNPNLNSAQSSLNEGASILSSINIPSTFSQAGSLSAMPNTVRNNSEKVSSLKKWVSDVVNKFTNAENANNAKVNQLNSSISNISLNSTSTAVAASSAEIDSITGFISNLADIIDNLFDNLTESENAVNATNAQISDSYESSTLIDGAFSLLSSIFDKVKDITATTLCTIYNASASIAKGFAQFIGALIDGVTIVGTAALTLITGIWDIGAYFLYDSSPSLKDFCEYMGDSATAVMWKNVMGFVSTSFVEDFFSKFYDSPLGQFIDDNAIGIFKSDAIGCDVLSGISYVAGIALSTIFTMGVAGGVAGAGTATSAATGTAASSSASTLVSSVFAAISALGKYTGESWKEDKLNSWKGIRESYKNGDISYDDYNSMLLIRNMSDEDWLDIYNQVGKGEISWEQLNKLKKIRNMPDDWRNLENWGAGLAYGGSNALWEGLQYLVGGLLGGSEFLTGKLGSAVRIGVDTIFNMADTPFRTLITAGTTGKSIGDVFEAKGGWSSMLADTLVGLIGSVGGEVFDQIKSNKLNSTSKFENNYDDYIAEYINNIQNYAENGVSLEEFLTQNKIKIPTINTKKDAAEFLGDFKLYVLESAKENINKKYLPSIEKNNLLSWIQNYQGSYSTADIDANYLYETLSKYLTNSQIKNAQYIANNGLAEFINYSASQVQKDAVYNYTRCGGFEINAWLNDTTLPLKRGPINARVMYSSLEEIQNVISGVEANGRYNRVLTTSDANLIDCLDSLIASTNYDKPVVTYRGLKGLFNENKQIDPSTLRIGDSFTSHGYQSSSVVLESSYGMKQGYDIILKILVPPNSGTAAYIENISGAGGYEQMEMLIKRDAIMTVVGDIEYKVINGVLKTIVPVLVQ